MSEELQAAARRYREAQALLDAIPSGYERYTGYWRQRRAAKKVRKKARAGLVAAALKAGGGSSDAPESSEPQSVCPGCGDRFTPRGPSLLEGVAGLFGQPAALPIEHRPEQCATCSR